MTTENQTKPSSFESLLPSAATVSFQRQEAVKKSDGEKKMLATNGDDTVHNAIKYSMGKSLFHKKSYTTFLMIFPHLEMHFRKQITFYFATLGCRGH